MDSKAIGSDSWGSFPPVPHNQELQRHDQELHRDPRGGDAGVFSETTHWKRLMAEIIEDVFDCSSTDLIGFDTFQEGE